MINLLKKFFREEDGPTAVEYAVILGLLVAGVMGSVTTLTTATANSFNETSAQITAAIGS